ncbi:extracellular matrix protein 1 [Vipera latastei]
MTALFLHCCCVTHPGTEVLSYLEPLRLRYNTRFLEQEVGLLRAPAFLDTDDERQVASRRAEICAGRGVWRPGDIPGRLFSGPGSATAQLTRKGCLATPSCSGAPSPRTLPTPPKGLLTGEVRKRENFDLQGLEGSPSRRRDALRLRARGSSSGHPPPCPEARRLLWLATWRRIAEICLGIALSNGQDGLPEPSRGVSGATGLGAEGGTEGKGLPGAPKSSPRTDPGVPSRRGAGARPLNDAAPARPGPSGGRRGGCRGGPALGGGGDSAEARVEKGRSPRRRQRLSPERARMPGAMRTMTRLWLCLCCLAAWPAGGRSASEAPPPADGSDQPPPAQFPVELSQHDVIPDVISREFLIQKIQEKLGEDGEELPILVHGEPQSIPLQPRGRRPPCSRVGCTRTLPLYKLEDFPPGRPSLDNLEALCSVGRRKPSYGPWNLPQTSFSHLSRQGEALNQLEVQFTRCCRLAQEQKLSCASNEWEKSLTRFCKQEFSVKTRPFHCCRVGARKARLACFASQAPFPAYQSEGASLDLANLTTPVLDSICSQASSQPKQRANPALVQNITDSCCKLAESERTLCAEEVKSQFITALCGSQRRSWKDPQNCCAQTEEAARKDCFDHSYLGHVSLLLRQEEEDLLPTPISFLNPPGA